MKIKITHKTVYTVNTGVQTCSKSLIASTKDYMLRDNIPVPEMTKKQVEF